MTVRMYAPFTCCIVSRSMFFSRVPETEKDARSRAADMMRRAYERRLARFAECCSRSAEEWKQVAYAAHCRIRALNLVMRLTREVMIGAAKKDLRSGLLTQEEYKRLRQTFRERTADERRELARLVREQARAHRYAAQLRLGFR